MINVKVYYRALSQQTGKTEETIPAETVKDVLAYIKKTYGSDTYKEARRMLIAVDGDSIQLHKGFDTRLEEGMEVRFLPICGGG